MQSKAAILMLAAKLFGTTRRIAADGLAHLFILSNAFAE
jgi:hypothetical protein